jgi:hypothetical protein
MVVASQKLAGGDSVDVVVCSWLCSKVKSVDELNLLLPRARTCTPHIRGPSGPVSAW